MRNRGRQSHVHPVDGCLSLRGYTALMGGSEESDALAGPKCRRFPASKALMRTARRGPLDASVMR